MNDPFKENGLKKTKERKLVYEALEKERYPLTAETLYAHLPNKDMALSTVYRTLNTLVQHKVVKKEINSRGEYVFSLEKKEDEHVLVCVSCHKKIPLPDCPYQEANEKLKEETGYQILDHNTEIYGLCPDCQKKQRRHL